MNIFVSFKERSSPYSLSTPSIEVNTFFCDKTDDDYGDR